MINKKVLAVIGNILIYFIAIGLLGMSMFKLMGEKNIVEHLEAINMRNPILLGILEMTCAALLAFPPTRRIGILMCTAYIGGIIVAENHLYGKPVGGVFLATLLWIGAFLREPDFFGLKPKEKKTDNH